MRKLLIAIGICLSVAIVFLAGGGIILAHYTVNEPLTAQTLNESKKLLLQAPVLRIEAGRADVRIVESEEPFVTYTGTIEQTPQIRKPRIEVQEDERETSITIAQEEHVLILGNAYQNERTTIHVGIPLSFHGTIIVDTTGNIAVENHTLALLEISTTSGDTKLRNITANTITLTALSGNINAHNLIAQEIQAKTSSGDITLVANATTGTYNTLSGDILLEGTYDVLTLETTSGTVQAANIRKEVFAHTLSGDVLLTLNQADADIQTTSGDVSLAVPENTNANILFSSTSGTTHITLPLIVQETQTHQFRGMLGNGTKTIRVHTLSGNFALNAQS